MVVGYINGFWKPESGGAPPNRSIDFVAASNQSLELSTANFGAYDRSMWAFSCWARRKGDITADCIFSIGDTVGAAPAITIQFSLFRAIEVFTYNATSDGQLSTPMVFSPGSGYEAGNFYHIYVTFNSAASAADRLQLIVDGTRVSGFATETQPVGNIDNVTGLVRIGRQSEDSNAADAYVYQPAFFSGVIPAVNLIYNGGAPRDIRGMTGLWSLLHTTDASTLEDDEIISTNWTNNNTVTKSTTIPT